MGIGLLLAVLASDRGADMIGRLFRGGRGSSAPQNCGGGPDGAFMRNTIRALIYSARAGEVADSLEIERESRSGGLPAETRRFVGQCLAEDISPGRIARNLASSDREGEAFWLYAFSCSVIQAAPVSAREREYLDSLAAALGIQGAAKMEIERRSIRRREKRKDLN